MTTTNSNFLPGSQVTAAVVAGNSTNDLRFAASEAQLEIWLSSQQSVEANCAYNEITSLRFTGELDTDALRTALMNLVERHDSLRAKFSKDGVEMVVMPQLELQCELFDWTDQSAGDQDVSRLKLLQSQACNPFDLEEGPLVRFALQQMGANEYFLTVTAHHIVLDGWSLGVLCHDLGHFYDAAKGLSPEPLPAAVSYREHSIAMSEYFDSQQAFEDLAFWQEQFEDMVPVLDLPIDSSRPALRTYFARRYDHLISADLMKSIQKLGAKSGCSVFNTLLTAFESFVSRISGSDDFCIGIPTAGQLAMDQPELIGHCVNTMPFRSQVDLQRTFNDQMKQTRSKMLDAFEHQRYSFGKILSKVSLARDPSRPPMVAVSFNVDPAINTDEIGFDGLQVDILVEPRMFENFEWFVNGVINFDKSVEFQVQYNTDLFSSIQMKALFAGFEGFLKGLVQSEGQDRLANVPVLNVEQLQELLVDWNQTDRDYGAANALHAEFTRQAKTTPDNVAVRFGESSLTYRELDEQSNQFAKYLLDRGVKHGDLVGICLPRSERMVTALLGILKTGAGYVPLDPVFPADRLRYMCDHSGLKLVVGAESVRELADTFGKPILEVEEFDRVAERFSTEQVATEIETEPGDTCYVIYTSGSTGEPKGVNIPHGAVVNFLYSMAEQPGFTADDSVLAVTTLSFDIAVLELYLPLLVGGTTVVASKEMSADGGLILNAIEQHNITLFQSTPATLRLMIAAGWKGQGSLKVLCGGEPMPTDLVVPLFERCSELWNMYGPTETTVWSSVFKITDPAAPILIGKPIANTQIYLLDANLQPVPVGSDGEIYIGGAGVTLGYLNQDQMTSERFVENRYFNPFADYCNYRLYRTGDLGRYRRDGNLQFLRRNDKQVKVRGFRIELGEIESAFKSFKGIEQAVAIVREDKPGDTRLVAYWIAEPGFTATSQDLRSAMRDALPYYMVPQHFVQLDAMPETANKKIDYKALPSPTDPAADPNASDEMRLPSTPLEKYVASVWEQILELDDVTAEDNFFDLGGHSLLMMKVINDIEQRTGARLNPPEFLVGTLEQIADAIGEKVDLTGTEFEVKDSEVAQATNESNVETIGLQDVSDVTTNSQESKTVFDLKVELNKNEKTSLFKRIANFWD